MNNFHLTQGSHLLAVFLDTETNGLDPRKHRILELCFKVISLSDKRTLGTFDRIISQPDEVWNSSDKTSLTINGFKKEYLLNGISEAEAAKEIKNIFKKNDIHRKKAIFICQNPSFDRAFFGQLIPPDEQERLFWPYHWLDLASMFFGIYVHDHGKLPTEIGLSKDKIAAFYGLPPENKPHRAIAGVDHLIDCYFAVIKKKLLI